MSFAKRLNNIIGGVFPKIPPTKTKIPERDMKGFRNKIVADAAAKRKAAPLIQNTNAQVEGVKKGLMGVKKSQQTFGVPGAK